MFVTNKPRKPWREVVSLAGSIIISMALTLSVPAWAKDDGIFEFSKEVEGLLASNQLDKLEPLARDLRASDARFPGGSPKLSGFYSALGAVQGGNCGCGGYESTISVEKKEAALKQWIDLHPQSLPAHVAMAQFWIANAWKARGHGYANRISPEQWKLYADRMGKAHGYLVGLNPKDDPHIYLEYLKLADAAASPRKTLDLVYAAAIRDYPTDYEFYSMRAERLQEKWYGSPGQLASYAESLLHSPGGEIGQIAYAFVAGTLRSEDSAADVLQRKWLPWPSVKQAYQVMEKRYGFSNGDWNSLVDYINAAEDGPFAVELLPKLRAAAEDGNATAQANLGWLYVTGLGAEKDTAEAKRWYQKAADQGEATAQYQLGWIYAHVDPKDYVEAMRWYQSAAKQDKKEALNNIGSLYENGLGVKQDYAEAARWYQRAATKGYFRSELHLGSLYYRGLGVPHDEALAYQWIGLASDAGDNEAKQWLEQHPR